MPKEKDYTKIEKIFSATLKLVMVEGFSGLRMSDVAKHANIATGTLYIYFKTKHELINELYSYLKFKTTREYINEKDFDLSFKEAFDLVWKKYLMHAINFPFETAFIEQYYRSPFLDKKVKQDAYELIKPIYDLLDRGKKEKILKPIENELLIGQITGPINELTKMHHEKIIELNQNTISLALKMAWDSIKK
jgi:AcrR family transcriptional regulator